MEFLARFVGIWMMFVIYIALGVEGVAYDGDCTGSGVGDCAEANNKCNSGTSKCTCDDDSFRRTSPAECVIKIVAGTTCIAGDTCADTNAACDATELKCLCTSTYFQKNDNTCESKVVNLEDACVTAETATDQCTVADSECRASQCLCKDTHYKSGSSCTARIAPGETCAVDQCVTHATCDTVSNPTKCECDSGYTATPTDNPTMCSGVVKFASLSYMYVVPILVSMMSLLH